MRTGLDPNLIDLSNSDFIQLVRWLNTYTNPISLPELEAWLQTGRPLPPRATLLTFNDGYKDNLDAAEIMAHYSVPGIFFIAPRMITQRSLGWWEQTHYAIWNTKVNEYHYDGRHFWLPEERHQLYEHVTNKMKCSLDSSTFKGVTKLIHDLQAPMPEEVVERSLMTIDDIKFLSETLGMAIGSHGLTSRIFSTLAPVQQLRELEDSKRLLEGWIDGDVVSLAYPFGGLGHFNEFTRSAAEQAGYTLAMTLIPDNIYTSNVDRYALPRISSQGNWQLDTATVAHPGLFKFKSSHAQ